MVKGKKKDDSGKILSEFKIRLEGLEYLNLAESVKRFEQEDMAKYSHIGIEDFCALLKDNSFDDICRAIGLAWSTRGPGLRGSHPRV
jgi:hypothetical protein